MIRTTQDLYKWLCEHWIDRADSVVAVELSKTKPNLTYKLAKVPGTRLTKDAVVVPVEPADWQQWARQSTLEWFTVSASGVKVYLGTDPVPGRLLIWTPYKAWQYGGLGAGNHVEIYHASGPHRIYWITGGLRESEPISTSLNGSYAVVTTREPSLEERAELRTMVTSVRPGDWKLPPDTQTSTSLTASMALNDCLEGGVARAYVDETATWLRHVLPQYKVGAPSREDVALKLDLERRLRIEEKVVGSVRPLAFTLQAVDDLTYAWPGLWLVSGNLEDFRTDLPVLLAWDATLFAVMSIARLHVDVKPGLCYGPMLSQSVLQFERRFSKRDVGLTEGAYSQVNPTRIVGPAPVVASRLLQAATHELAHLVLNHLQTHPETFATRREQLFLTASELLPALVELVQRLNLDQRPSRTVPVAPITLENWLHEILLSAAVLPVAHLVRSWATVRNLTEGRAQRDIEDALSVLSAAGRCRWSPGNACVINNEPRPAHLPLTS